MGKTWRIILDGLNNAYYNMAKDETLLLSYKSNSLPTLRVYSWSHPSLTLGYRQKAEEILELKKCQEENIPVVRRITGGGAILHYEELTYSMVCGINDLDIPFNVKASYEVINSFLIRFYDYLGLKASFAIRNNPHIKSQKSHFCFSSHEPLDIVIGTKKIGGNAQRRTKHIIFQQGSIPLNIKWNLINSLFKKGYNGTHTQAISLNEATNKNNKFTHLRRKLIESFVETFKIPINTSDITPLESKIINTLIETKYSQDKWNFNK